MNTKFKFFQNNKSLILKLFVNIHYPITKKLAQISKTRVSKLFKLTYTVNKLFNFTNKNGISYNFFVKEVVFVIKIILNNVVRI